MGKEFQKRTPFLLNIFLVTPPLPPLHASWATSSLLKKCQNQFGRGVAPIGQNKRCFLGNPFLGFLAGWESMQHWCSKFPVFVWFAQLYKRHWHHIALVTCSHKIAFDKHIQSEIHPIWPIFCMSIPSQIFSLNRSFSYLSSTLFMGSWSWGLELDELMVGMEASSSGNKSRYWNPSMLLQMHSSIHTRIHTIWDQGETFLIRSY